MSERGVEYFDIIAPDTELPAIDDWVVVVATQDATDPAGGALWRFAKPNQWRHRSTGLLLAAADDYRCITKEDE